MDESIPDGSVAVRSIVALTMAAANGILLGVTINELKQRMERLGWSQSDLAEKAGIDSGHLSRVLNGKRRMTRLMASHLERVTSQDVSHT